MKTPDSTSDQGLSGLQDLCGLTSYLEIDRGNTEEAEGNKPGKAEHTHTPAPETLSQIQYDFQRRSMSWSSLGRLGPLYNSVKRCMDNVTAKKRSRNTFLNSDLRQEWQKIMSLRKATQQLQPDQQQRFSGRAAQSVLWPRRQQ